MYLLPLFRQQAQIEALRKTIPKSDGLDIQTIDKFQGQERDCIILSSVRSNKVYSCGFLADGRRLNVSITRAQRGFIFVGDVACLAQGDKDGAWNSFLDHIWFNWGMLDPKNYYWPLLEKPIAGHHNNEPRAAPREIQKAYNPSRAPTAFTADDMHFFFFGGLRM